MNRFYIASGIGLGLVWCFGIVLSSTLVFAEETAIDNVTITVPEACTITSSSGSTNTYSETMTSGQYKNNIGKTRLTISCNTDSSFAVYAVGYSNDTFGNNEMIVSNSGTSNIPTGTATSGDISQWAMKLESVASGGLTNNYTPTIISPFNDFAAVPKTYEKVAEVTSFTENIAKAAVDASYAVYVSSTQPTGSYTGKVRYAVVHPSSEVPVQPYGTQAGKIGYYPNAVGVADTMGDQDIASTDTSATLLASNFKRAGYGFAGWSDKYDWIVNANDTSGNGTGANVGYHIYGPNQTINFTAGQYSGTNKGLSLYAVWVRSQGAIQNWNGCGAMNIGEVTALTDIRDNNTYAVAKLADGKCWMMENLRLGGTTAMTLDSTTTNIADGTTFTLSASIDPTWCTEYDAACIDRSMLFSPTPPHGLTFYSYGNYYNYYSATAGNETYSQGSSNAAGDICPIGWHLPYGGEAATANGGNTPGGFYYLNYKLNNDSNTTDSTASNKLRSYPNNFIYSGHIAGSFSNSKFNGYYWASTVGSEWFAQYCGLSRNYIIPGTSNTNKYDGLSVKCVIEN